MKTSEPSSQYMRMACDALHAMVSSAELNDSIGVNFLYNEIRAKDRPFSWLLHDRAASMMVYFALQKYDVDISPIPNSGGVWTNMMTELAKALESMIDA